MERLLNCFKPNIKNLFPSTPDLAGKYFWFWQARRNAASRNICLVAHIDTVYPCTEESPTLVMHGKQKVLHRPTGLGADDRAGVFAALFLRKLTGCMLLLTDLEEQYGIGAKAASRYLAPILRRDVDFFIEIDRQGKDDMVFYNNEPKRFRDMIGKFGFNERGGSFTDISILGRKTKVAGVNLSTGYYGAHTLKEYLVVDELILTIGKVAKILETKGSQTRRQYLIPAKAPRNLLQRFDTTPSWMDEPNWRNHMEEMDSTWRDHMDAVRAQ